MPGKSDDTGGTKNGGDDKVKEGSIITRDEFDTKITELGSVVKELIEANKGSNAQIADLTATLKVAQEAKDKPEKEKELSDDELEHIDRKQLLTLIEGKVGKIMDEKLSSIGKDVTRVQDRVSKAELERQVNAAKAAHSDLVEWKDEMMVEAHINPNLGIEDMYILARSKHPEKAKEIDEKLIKEAKAAGEGGGQGSGKKPFGGLTPTSGQTDATTNMTQKEASEKAWDDAMGNIDLGALLGDESAIPPE